MIFLFLDAANIIWILTYFTTMIACLYIYFSMLELLRLYFIFKLDLFVILSQKIILNE